MKDTDTFDFMKMSGPYNEQDGERQLTQHITQILLELGKGFAFIGRQFHLEVGGNDYYIDLLFYHVVLKSYVVVELKNRQFMPEYAGKLNFYLSAVNALLKRDDDHPTIGLLLCLDKNIIEVKFALRDMNKPIGVSEYDLVESLPDQLKDALPTIEEIEHDLQQLQKHIGVNGALNEEERIIEATQRLEDQLKSEIAAKVMLKLHQKETSRNYLAKHMGRSIVTADLNTQIKRLIKLGLIEMTLPDVPCSPHQKYRLTESGQDMIDSLSNDDGLMESALD